MKRVKKKKARSVSKSKVKHKKFLLWFWGLAISGLLIVGVLFFFTAAGAFGFDQFLNPIAYRYRGPTQYVGDAQLYIVRCPMSPELSFQAQQQVVFLWDPSLR